MVAVVSAASTPGRGPGRASSSLVGHPIYAMASEARWPHTPAAGGSTPPFATSRRVKRLPYRPHKPVTPGFDSPGLRPFPWGQCRSARRVHGMHVTVGSTPTGSTKGTTGMAPDHPRKVRRAGPIPAFSTLGRRFLFPEGTPTLHAGLAQSRQRHRVQSATSEGSSPSASTQAAVAQFGRGRRSKPGGMGVRVPPAVLPRSRTSRSAELIARHELATERPACSDSEGVPLAPASRLPS